MTRGDATVRMIARVKKFSSDEDPGDLKRANEKARRELEEA